MFVQKFIPVTRVENYFHLTLRGEKSSEVWCGIPNQTGTGKRAASTMNSWHFDSQIQSFQKFCLEILGKTWALALTRCVFRSRLC